jgi:putative MATE family efflux protein
MELKTGFSDLWTLFYLDRKGLFELFKSGLTARHFIRVITLGAPLLVGLIAEFFMYTADSAMVGRLGTDHLAAIGIATMFAELLWVIVWPFAPGTQALTARRFGRQQAAMEHRPEAFSKLRHETGLVLDNALIVAIVAGVGAIGIASFSHQILALLIDNKDLIRKADSYIEIIKYLMPIAGIFFAMYGFLAALNLTRVVMVASVSLNLLNIVFNYALIFGKFGLPAMGIQGAAIGTLLAQFMGATFLAVYILFARSTKEYHCFRFDRLRVILMRDIFVAASPIIAQLSVSMSIFLLYEAVIESLGTVYLAVTHVLFMSFIFVRTMIEGFAEGGSILVGNYLGVGNRKEATRYAYAAELISIAIGAFLVTFIFVFPQHIVGIFNQEPGTIELGIKGLRFIAVFFFIGTLGFPIEVIFTHNGWGRYALFSEFIPVMTFTLGLTLLLVKGFNKGIYAAWLSCGLYILFYTALLIAGFMSKRWLAVEVESKGV